MSAPQESRVGVPGGPGSVAATADGSGTRPGAGLEELIRSWDGLAVVVRYDAPAEAWLFIALHDLTLGPGLGGCRMMVYPSPEAGLRDAMRLARGMTEKWAIVGFPYGGAKAVIALSRPLEEGERDGLLRRFGRLVESLRGTYGTGEDLGTTPADMALIAQETRFAHGGRESGDVVDPGPYTALGVFEGIRAALEHLEPGADLALRTVLVQGVGDVGLPLARLLARAGARVLVADLDAERAARVAEEVGEVVPPERVYETECDVYAPCAVGGTIDAVTAGTLRCRIVAGSANNQLATPELADVLHRRGILYVPDYVINAGGATALPLVDRGVEDETIRERVTRIGPVVAAILAEARDAGEPPLRASRRRVERILEEARAGRLHLEV